MRSKLQLDYLIPEPDARQEHCEAIIKDQPAGWRLRRGYGNNCQRWAVYKVNDRKLCRIHAGADVLDILMKDHPTHYYRISNQPSLQRRP